MADSRQPREGRGSRSSGYSTQNRRPKRRRRRYSSRLYVLIGVLVLLLVVLVFLLSKLFGGGGDDNKSQQAAQTSQAMESMVESSAMETEPVVVAPTAAPAAASEWYLILVNKDNPVPDDYKVELTNLRNDQAVDARIYPDLQAMFDDMRSQNLSPMITSSYRSAEDQQKIMDSPFTVVYPDSKNPYRQMYVPN